jgi:hypothetical protein
MKRTAMRRRPKPSDHDPVLSRRWLEATVNGKACVVCGRTRREHRVVIQGHHPIKQQAIEREFPHGARWDADYGAFVYVERGQDAELTTQQILWDTRNAAPLCIEDHERHTAGVVRLPFTVLGPGPVQFARDFRTRAGVDLMYLLEREHPPSQPKGASNG